MRALFVLIFSIYSLSGCNTANSTSDEPEFRIAGLQFSLGMTHNSHLGRSYSSPESAYSATITFEVFLTEETDYTKISQFALVDEENKGWVYDSLEVQKAYYSDNNSLRFVNLELRIFDYLSRKPISAQFLDISGTIIRERVFSLDNDFPLPALTTLQPQENNELVLTIDFYNTPYDGGNIPFPVTIYNTAFVSNSFSISWLNANNEFIQEDYLGTNALDEIDANSWELRIDEESIPANAAKVFAVYRRGGFTRGGVLYTEIISLPGND